MATKKQRRRRANAQERAQIRLAVLRPFDHVPYAPNGDATRGSVLGEVTLEIGNPDACYRGWGVKNFSTF